MWIYVYHTSTGTCRAQKGIPKRPSDSLKWSYTSLWATMCVLGTEPGPLQKQPVPLTTDTSLSLQVYFFFSVGIGIPGHTYSRLLFYHQAKLIALHISCFVLFFFFNNSWLLGSKIKFKNKTISQQPSVATSIPRLGRTAQSEARLSYMVSGQLRL